MEDWIAALKTVQNREHFEVIRKCVPLHSVLHLLPLFSVIQLVFRLESASTKVNGSHIIDYNGYSVRPSVNAVRNTLK